MDHGSATGSVQLQERVARGTSTGSGRTSVPPARITPDLITPGRISRGRIRADPMAPGSRVMAPPPVRAEPVAPAPAGAQPTEPPVWAPVPAPQPKPAPPAATGRYSGTADRSRGSATQQQLSDPSDVRARRARRAGTGLCAALAAFYLLQLGGGLLTWYEAEIRLPGQKDVIVGYGLCLVLLVPAFVLRGRWRVLPTIAACLAGAAVPLVVAGDMFAMLGIQDVWVGQSLTLHVLFPLAVGGSAVLAQLLGGRVRRR